MPGFPKRWRPAGQGGSWIQRRTPRLCGYAEGFSLCSGTADVPRALGTLDQLASIGRSARPGRERIRLCAGKKRSPALSERRGFLAPQKSMQRS